MGMVVFVLVRVYYILLCCAGGPDAGSGGGGTNAGGPNAGNTGGPAAPAPKSASKSDDPNEAFDVEGANAELMARSEDFLSTLDESQWFSDILNFAPIAVN